MFKGNDSSHHFVFVFVLSKQIVSFSLVEIKQMRVKNLNYLIFFCFFFLLSVHDVCVCVCVCVCVNKLTKEQTSKQNKIQTKIEMGISKFNN